MNVVEEILKKIAKNKQSKFISFFVVLTALTTIMVFAYQPTCPGHDFYFHFRRLNSLMLAFQNGTFPYYTDYTAIDGYGYFTKAFYSDLILIPFAIIGNLTNAIFAYNSMIFVMTILCGLFTYWAVKTVYKCQMAASMSAILYTFCTYRLLDIYHRTAVGEYLSFTFVPLVFVGLYFIIRGDYRKWYILAIGYSLMIYTHLISSVLMLITIIIFLLIYNKSLRRDPKRIMYLGIAGLSVLILTAYYIYPMLEQMSNDSFYYETKSLMAKAEDSKLAINWIFWGLLGGGVQPAQIFVPGTGILLTCAVCIRLFVHEKTKQLRSADVLVMVGLVYFVAVSTIFPWGIFPFNKLNFIQLPWRLYEFISFFFAVAGGYYFAKALKTNKRKLVAGMIMLLSTAFVILNDSSLYKEIRCRGSIDEPPFVGNTYHLGGLEYIPSAVPSIEYIAERGDKILADNTQTEIKNQKREKEILAFDVETNSNTTIELPLIYYKGYQVQLDGNRLGASQSKNGLVEVMIAKSGHITAYYGGTAIQKISYWITLLAVLALCIYLVSSKLQIKKETNNEKI